MTKKLQEVLSRRKRSREEGKPWVFWHRYWSRKARDFVEGPYGDRKKLIRNLCKKAKVDYFSFHYIRNAGASLLDSRNVPMGAIQRILGHENRRTTEIYLHSVGELERNAMVIYEAAREKSHTISHTDRASKSKGSQASS